VKLISAIPSPGVELSAVGGAGAIAAIAVVISEVPTTPLGAAELVAVATERMNFPTSSNVS
jgi:hypothetical protein